MAELKSKHEEFQARLEREATERRQKKDEHEEAGLMESQGKVGRRELDSMQQILDTKVQEGAARVEAVGKDGGATVGDVKAVVAELRATQSWFNNHASLFPPRVTQQTTATLTDLFAKAAAASKAAEARAEAEIEPGTASGAGEGEAKAKAPPVKKKGGFSFSRTRAKKGGEGEAANKGGEAPQDGPTKASGKGPAAYKTPYREMKDCLVELTLKDEVFIEDLTNCTIVCREPINASCYIRGCTSCLFIIQAQQVRIHNTQNSDFHITCASRPIIEDCTGLGFRLTNSKEGAGDIEVDDFNWIRAKVDTSARSPNFHYIDQELGESPEAPPFGKPAE